jgi:1-acyl-sn-glycerol-3-phosphate acyltransferase
VLGWFGWTVAGDLPTAPRAVLILAPHTSNWDFPVCMLAMLATGLRMTWIAKHTLFFWPARPILHWLGGEAVDRRVHAGRVQHAIERLHSTGALYLGIAPEGTRRRVAEWKTGFWRIADGAGVPIIPIALDWSTREVRITPAFTTTGVVEVDLPALRGRFRAAMARHPDHFADPQPADDTPPT